MVVRAGKDLRHLPLGPRVTGEETETQRGDVWSSWCFDQLQLSASPVTLGPVPLPGLVSGVGMPPVTPEGAHPPHQKASPLPPPRVRSCAAYTYLPSRPLHLLIYSVSGENTLPRQ